MKFTVLSLKRNIIPFFLVLLAIFLVIFSKTNLSAAKTGLTLWATSVVPSLFPFFVITELLSNTNVIYYTGKIFDKIMRPLFNVPGECAFAFIMGLISGYPTGAKIVSDLRKQEICTKDEGDRMLAFTNNSGPLFIISYVGISLFGDTKTGILLLCTHILASITVGIILAKLSTKNTKISNALFTKNVHNFLSKKTITISNLGKVMGNSIQNATSTILMIGGFVIIFSVIISIFEQIHLFDLMGNIIKPVLTIFGFSTNFSKPILSGIVELTNGLSITSSITIKNISQNVIISAFLLGFGGVSVLFQVFSLLAKTDLSINKYIIGKLLQGIISAFYTFLAFKFIPTLSLDIIPTCASISNAIIYPVSFFGISNYIILLFVIIFIICIAFSHKNEKKCFK